MKHCSGKNSSYTVCRISHFFLNSFSLLESMFANDFERNGPVMNESRQQSSLFLTSQKRDKMSISQRQYTVSSINCFCPQNEPASNLYKSQFTGSAEDRGKCQEHHENGISKVQPMGNTTGKVTRLFNNKWQGEKRPIGASYKLKRH